MHFLASSIGVGRTFSCNQKSDSLARGKNDKVDALRIANAFLIMFASGNFWVKRFVPINEFLITPWLGY